MPCAVNPLGPCRCPHYVAPPTAGEKE
ncbi:hypothetical protein NW845_10785 [Synechococcus sp. H60.2]